MAKGKKAEAKQAGSGASTAAAFALLTVLGGGIGALLGQQLFTSVSAGLDEPEQSAVEAATGEPGADQDDDEAAAATSAPPPRSVVPLEPILTNLLEPQDAWIRIEAMLVVTGEIADTATLAARIAGDVTGYLRTLPLSAIEGGTGLRYLTEDLNDIVRARSDGAVSEVVIKSLVVQ